MMRVSKLTLLLCAFISVSLLSGCSNKSKQPRLAAFQEPVDPLPYPKDQGAKELKRLWKESVDLANNSTYSRLKPIIFEQQVLVASNNGEVTSYRLNDGKELWQTDLDDAVYAGINAANGLATVALENGEIILLNALTGKIIWRQAMGRQSAATPAISDDFIIVRTVDGLLLGLDIKTGALRWQQQLKVSELGLHGTPEPVVVNNVVLVGMADGVLSAINAKNGNVFWVAQIGANNNDQTNNNQANKILKGIYAPPLVAGNLVIASNFTEQIAAYRLQSGDPVWNLPYSTYQPINITEEFIFVTDELGNVLTINALNSALIWQQGAFKGRGVSYPAVIGNRVAIGDNQGKIHLLDLTTGALKQSLEVAKGAIRQVIVYDKQILLFTARGELLMYQWQLPNKKEIKQIEVKEIDLGGIPHSNNLTPGSQ